MFNLTQNVPKNRIGEALNHTDVVLPAKNSRSARLLIGTAKRKIRILRLRDPGSSKEMYFDT